MVAVPGDVRAQSGASSDAARSRAPSFEFVSVGLERGIGAYSMASGFGAGVAAADYDGDGDIDLFVPNGPGVPNQLYLNLGLGVFTDVASAAGVASTISSRCALFADVDADGRLDLLVAHDEAGGGSIFRSVTLYVQTDSGAFVDRSALSGLNVVLTGSPSAHVGGMAAGDVNADGWLDLVVTYWGGGLHILLNDGDGTFTRVEIGRWPGTYWQPIIFDLDADGVAEIHACFDFGPNRLLRMGAGGVFENLAPGTGLDRAWNEMGATLGDVDGDGDLDVYCTNIARQGPGGLEHNVLLRNESAPGVLHFVEFAQEAGAAFGGYGWGTTFLDADRDGRLDLCEVNQTENPSSPTCLFWNVTAAGGPARLLDVGPRVGFGYHDSNSCVVAFDMDRDGDLDLAATVKAGPLRLLENRATGASGSWLVVRPRMSGPNTHAIGALVRVEAGGREMIRPITCGTSYMGQEPAEAQFGLGGAAVVDRVTVEWPGGGVSEVLGVAPGQVLDVVAP